MSDTSLNKIIQYGTAAQRAAFTPSPAAGSQVLYIWFETDTGDTYAYDGSWNLVGGGSGNVTSTSAFASPPGSPASGDLWFPNDSFYALRYSGSAWVPWGPIFPLIEPVSGDFAWINQGGASISTTNGGVYITAPAAAPYNIRIRKKAAPSTPYTITCAFLVTYVARGANSAGSVGICFRESSSGKLAVIQVYPSSAGANGIIASTKFTNETTFSAHYATATTAAPGGLWWFRIADNGTDRIVSVSGDGRNFLQFHSVGRTDFLTADEVGFFVDAPDATYPISMTLLSWIQG